MGVCHGGEFSYCWWWGILFLNFSSNPFLKYWRLWHSGLRCTSSTAFNMALVDELTILARAGKGGDGVVRWLHLKGKEYSGPAGGNGGNGGNFYVRGVRDISLLGRYRGEKKFEAESGKAGGNRNQDGSQGADLVVDLPVGSVVTNTATGEVVELMEEGQQIQILKGGRGGAGNAVFKSSVNRSP